MKPKTLKDMRYIPAWKLLGKNKAIQFKRYKDGELCKYKELKQEAIKWVKKYRRLGNEINSEYYRGKADGIMELNNITEEDLR